MPRRAAGARVAVVPRAAQCYRASGIAPPPGRAVRPVAPEKDAAMYALLLSWSFSLAALPQLPAAVDTPKPAPKTAPAGILRADTLPRFNLNALVVTVARTTIPVAENPAATSVVERQDLDAMPRSVAVDEAVRLVPGVKVDNQADGERVHMSIRGQGILSERGLRGIKVLQDGIPLNDPTGFAPDLYDVDWSNLERIEVLRGPGAALYGGGSTAGVLNLVTSPAGGTSAMSAEARTGSHGFRKLGVRGSGSTGGVGYELSLGRALGDGYRDHTAFAATNLYAKSELRPAARLTLTPVLAWTNFFNENAEGLNLTWLAENRRQANPDAITYNELQRTKRFTGGVVSRWAAGAGTELALTGFVRSTSYLEPVPSSIQHRTLLGPGVTVQLTQEALTGAVKHTLGAGTDLQWQSIDEYRVPNLGGAREGAQKLSDETIRQSGVGIFLLDRLDLGAGWSGMVNVRYDRIGNELADHLRAGGVDLSGSTDFQRATARLGLAWSRSPRLSVYANWGQGFLPPATEELANNPAAQGGFNASLAAASSRGEEVGVRGTAGQRLFYDVALFHLETHGDFDRYRISTRPLETFYRNGGNSRRFGAELFARWQPLAPLTLEGAYTGSHFVYRSSTSFYGDIAGHRLPNSPAHQLMTSAQLALGDGVTLGAGSDSYSRWYVDASNATSVARYTLLNAFASWRLPLRGMACELLLQGRNLTGTRYIAFTEPDPDGNSYQPGPEREIFTGLRLTLP